MPFCYTLRMKIAFKNKKFSVQVEKITLPNKERIEFATVIKQQGTIVIPFLDKNTIILNRQYRPAVKKWIYEFPGGKIEEGETSRQNAIKELEEETGYKAKKMRFLCKIYTAPYISNDLQYIYKAYDLQKKEQKLEKGEVISVRKVKLKDALKMIQEGEIDDAGTMIGLLMLKNKT